MQAKRENINSGDNLFKNNFRIIDLAEKINLPIFRETGYREWIDYGYDNNFPEFLTDVYTLKSITHKTIINRKQKMISGGGFIETPENILFLENIFSDDTMNDILNKISLDLELYGGYALNIIWSNSGDKISQIEYVPFESVRVDKNNGEFGVPDYYWISSDWSQKHKFQPKKIQGFSKKYKEEKSQIFYYKEHTVGSRQFYPIPSWYSSINYILAEWEISNFHRSSIQNGFQAGFLLNFSTGVPSPEEMEAAYKQIEDKYTGSWNAGKFILTFSEGKEQEPKFEPIQLQDSDARYTQLQETIRSSIFTANEVVTPELFGVSIPGQLGNKQQLLEGLEIFQSVYINYKQKSLEDTLSKFSKINGIKEPLKIEKYQLDIEKITEE